MVLEVSGNNFFAVLDRVESLPCALIDGIGTQLMAPNGKMMVGLDACLFHL